MKKYKFFWIIGLSLILALTFSSFGSFANECEDIKTKVLRLHILANSDSQSDQALKLEVRDAILEQSEILFEASNSKEDAILKTITKTDDIKAIADQVIEKNGFDYDANVEVCNMYFTTREYENFTLPAGYYDALRVTIGNANGKNWWCVLYPALCLGATTEKSNLEETFTDSEIKIITDKSPQYEISFAVIEIYEQIKNWINPK